jgi:hypothetical protein
MPTRRGKNAPKSRSARRRPNPSARSRARPHFVGREGSPVLDRYPPKESGIAGPPRPVVASVGPTSPATSVPAAPSLGVATPLITLERPFDLDAFSALLGQTSIRVTVPSSDLPEVLKRVTEFMGFGIYVYAIQLRPAPAELLKSFVVELQRVDYSAEKGAWVPFVERGAVDRPSP